MASDEATPKPEISIIRCIQQIRDRTVNVEALDKGTVLQCVEFLKLHGQGSYAIADTLGVSDRYVRRKMAIIRKHNAVKADPQFMAKLLGEFLINTRSHIDHLVQLSHSKDASVAEKSQARYCASNLCGYTPLDSADGPNEQWPSCDYSILLPCGLPPVEVGTTVSPRGIALWDSQTLYHRRAQPGA